MSIFVFGSNLAGRHGAGAARFALEYHGAIYGQGIGLQGNSYGIPTKDHRIRTLPLDEIQKHVRDFVLFAGNHPEMEFQVTRIGCGLAGYTDSDIAPMFEGAPLNCHLPDNWRYYPCNMDSSVDTIRITHSGWLWKNFRSPCLWGTTKVTAIRGQ